MDGFSVLITLVLLFLGYMMGYISCGNEMQSKITKYLTFNEKELTAEQRELVKHIYGQLSRDQNK